MHKRAPEPVDAAYVASLVALGHRHGLDQVGIAPATVMDRARHALVTRKAAGLHDTMAFTYRNPERSTDPSRAVAGAQAVLVGARSYAMEPPPRPEGPFGSVARYAWIDHYKPLRDALRVLVLRLRADGYRAVAFADDNSMVDREAAHLAGIGWFGKNANVLVPGAGSFFVLGSVVTTAPLPPAEQPMADGCGSCRRCLDGCPTAAIVAPGVVDAGRCLAWLLQRPGVFPREYRVALGDRVYGCDECQTVCPPTIRFERTAARPVETSAKAWVSLVAMLRASDDQLLADFGRWYLADRNPVWLRRNALVALGNSGAGTDPDVVAAVRDYVAHADPILRVHAIWAAHALGLGHLVPLHDDHPVVADELAAIAR